MAISTNGLQLVRLAGAVFNQRLSASDYSEILAANKTAAELDAWANAAVAAEFRNKTTTDIAKAVLANVGLSSIAGLEAWVAGQLTAGGGVAKAGASLLVMLNDYANMSTTEAIYGASVATFNQKVANSQTSSQTAGTATGTYAAVSAVAPAAPNASLTLTAGVDTTLVGGAGSDTYTATNTTLTAGDSLDGGAGTDTLSLTTILPGTYGAGARSIGVENLSVTATIGDATVDATGLVGLTKVTSVGSTQAVTVTGLTTIPSLELTGSSNNLTATMAAAAVIGAADSISIALNGAGTAASSTAAVTANGVETINVASSGSASGTSSTSVTVASNTLTTLNVTGSVAAKVAADLIGATALITGTVTSDDGAHDVEILNADVTDKLSVSMGAGNDTVRTGGIAAIHTIAGGDGTDTLRYTGATAVTLAATANVSGIETVTLSNAANASFAMTGAGVTTVNYTTAGAGTFGGLSTGGTVNLNVGGTVTVAAAGAAATATSAATTTAATYSGTADSLTVNVGLATTTTGSAASTVNAIGVESVTINSLTAAGGTEARTVTFGDTTATTGVTKSMTVTSSGTGTITAAFSPTGTSALTSVNMAGVTGSAVFASGTTLVGVAITGGSSHDTLTGGAAADTILGGEGNDVLGGGAGADSIDGGNGANNITGGAGADSLTGGTGVDTYVFASNATTATTPVLTSTLSAPDTISNFTSGTDKISITGAYAPVAFLGNYVNIQAALAAATTPALAYSAAFVTGESSLYVFQLNTGALNADDMVIKMPGVTALVAGDLLLGSQGTGNGITLNLAAANVTSSTSLNATETTAAANTPSGSANTTSLNDTVTTRYDFLVGSTVEGGVGTDTLALSNNVAFTQASVTFPSTVTGFETITLANYTPATSTANNRYYDITLAAANVPTNTTLTVTSSEDGLSFDGSMITSGVIFTASNLAASQPINFTGAGAQDSVTGGSGNDTISGGDGNDTLKAGIGTNTVKGDAGDDSITSASLTDVIDGGAGNDTVTLITGAYTGTLTGGSGVTDVLAIVASTDIDSATVSTFETLNVSAANNAASAYLLSVAQAAAFTDVTATTVTTASNVTFTLDATTTAKATGSITLDASVGKYTVAASAAAGVTFVSPATYTGSITGGVGDDVINFSSNTVVAAQTLIGGDGNDTITTPTSIFAATDVVTGGVGTTDTLVLSGNTALGNVGTDLLTEVEFIQIRNTTTSVALSISDATVAAGGSLTITTDQTTGALTITGGSELDGSLIVTGGGGDDSLTGGAIADTLSGGAGSDTIIGGAGIDTINSGTGNNSVDGGLGNDVITLGTGVDIVQFTETETDTTIFRDSITGFTTGTGGDVLRFSSGDLDSDGVAGMDLVDGAGTTLGASIGVGALLLTSVATGADVTMATGGAGGAAIGMVKFSSITSTSIASAMGSSVFTIVDANHTAAEALLAMFYNATDSSVVIGYFVDSTAGVTLTAAEFVPIATLVGISTDNYTALTAANLAIG